MYIIIISSSSIIYTYNVYYTGEAETPLLGEGDFFLFTAWVLVYCRGDIVVLSVIICILLLVVV